MNKTTVITLCSIKGGVGKTHIAVLLARCLAKSGYRILMIDSDLNNSLSFYHLAEEAFAATKKLNLYYALSDETNNLCDFAIKTRTENIDLIASSPYLSDLRTISELRLRRMLPALHGVYDYLIIDTHPTYDNIVLSAIHAADFMVMPVLKDTFSFNAAKFMAAKMPLDAPEVKNWYVLLNGWDSQHAEARSGRQHDFLELYNASGLPLMPRETWLPWSTGIHSLIDYRKMLSSKPGVANTVYHDGLHKAIAELAECFVSDGRFTAPEVF